MYKVRYVERIGTPGRMLNIASKEELLHISAGCKIYKDGWEITEPENGCTIVVIPKDPVTAGLLIGAWALTLIGVGVGFGVIAPLINRLDNLNNMDSPSPSNSLRGSNNQYRANGRIPIILGEHLLTPDLAMKPYTSYGSHEQYLHQLFCLGYKNDVKFVTNSEKIGNTELNSFKNYRKANNTSYANRLVHELNVGIELKDEEGKAPEPIARYTPDNTTKITVGISMPHGLYKYDEDYNRGSYSVTFVIEVYTADGTTPVKTAKETLSENRDYVRHSVVFDGLTRGKYRVNVWRSGDKKGDTKHVETMYWDVLQSDLLLEDGTTTPISSTIAGKLNLISLKIQASDQLNGMVDEFNVQAYTHIRDYKGSGSGSGVWTKKKTSNPASLLLYVLQNANINPKPVPSDKIEWAEFEEYWRWCDEKGYTFNAVLTGDYTIADLVEMITNASRASLTMYNGKYGVVIDRAVNSVDFHLTPKNTMGGTLQTKPFVGEIKNLKCRFADRDSGYAENELIIAVDENGKFVSNEQEGDTQEVTFVGITDKEQMWDIGKHELAKATRRVVTYSVQQDWEYLTAYPGAVGYLANDMLLYGIKSGRIKGVNHNEEGKVTSVILDENVFFEENKSYSLVVRHNDESLGVKTYHVTREEAEGDYILLSSPIDADIEEGNIYSFAERGKDALKVLCKSITPSSDHSATLELVEYREEIYTNSDVLDDWVSAITIPPETDNPGWDKDVPPYIPPAKPGDPAKDIRLTSSATSIHSSGRGILVGENITLQCKLFNMDHITADIMPTEHEGGETVDDTPLSTTIVWNGNGISLSDTEDPLVKIIDLQSDGVFEYIRQKGTVIVEVNFTNTDGIIYSDSITMPIIYDGKNSEYLGFFDYIPESTLAGEPLLEGDWFLVKKSFEDEQGNKYTLADVYEYYSENQEAPWQLCTNASKIAQTLPDMAQIDMADVDNADNPGRVFFERLAVNQAFINKLVAQHITIPLEGSIRSAGFTEGDAGFLIDGSGSIIAENGTFNGVFRSGKGASRDARVGVAEVEGITLPEFSGNQLLKNNMVITDDGQAGSYNISLRISEKVVYDAGEIPFNYGEVFYHQGQKVGYVTEDKGNWDDGWRYIVAADNPKYFGKGREGVPRLTSEDAFRDIYSYNVTEDSSGLTIADREYSYLKNLPDREKYLAYKIRHTNYKGLDDWYKSVGLYPIKDDIWRKISDQNHWYAATGADYNKYENTSEYHLIKGGGYTTKVVDGNSTEEFYPVVVRRVTELEIRKKYYNLDAFQYRIDTTDNEGNVISEGAWSNSILIWSGNEHILGDTGIKIKFMEENVHTVGDTWSFSKTGLKGLEIKNSQGTPYLTASDGVVTADRLRITGSRDASESSIDHPVQIASGNALTMKIDGNEILTMNGKSLSPLWIPSGANFGGDVEVKETFKPSKIRMPGKGMITGSGDDHPFQIGASNDYHIKIDNKKIVARNGFENKKLSIPLGIDVGMTSNMNNLNVGSLYAKWLTVTYPKIPTCINVSSVSGLTLFNAVNKVSAKTRTVRRGTLTRRYRYENSVSYEFDYIIVRPWIEVSFLATRYHTNRVDFYQYPNKHVATADSHKGNVVDNNYKYTFSAAFEVV